MNFQLRHRRARYAFVWASMSSRLSGLPKAIFISAVMCLLALNGTGCIVLVAGGAGAVGYEVAKDDRKIGTKVSDASVTSSVKTRLIKDSGVKAGDINVDTYDGVVTLHGHVPNSGVKTRAVKLAKSVKGVKSVRSKLKIISD